MKKLLLIICVLSLWTTSSSASTSEHSNLILDSELINTNFSIINHENFTLVPTQFFLDALNIPYNISKQNNEKITITFFNNTLELFLNSDQAIINGQKVSLLLPTIVKDHQVYTLLNLFNDLTNFHIIYDKTSNSIFATSESNFNKIKFFFGKIENVLKQFYTINIDIINEIISPDGVSYSIGNNIQIDKISNKIFQKNMLDTEWTETNIKISPTNNINFNSTFFAGISVDTINSNNDYIVFKGYYPLDNNRICNSTLYINPETLKIEKQTSNFTFEGNTIKQTIFYSYNKEKA